MADHLNSPLFGGLGGKKQASKIIFFAVSKILFTFAPANQIFLPF
jgi:hypothetical protein